MHGELRFAGSRGGKAAGSSPRAWGTPVVLRFGYLFIRFIPTCMGNSLGDGRQASLRPVHPHVHGELAPPQVHRSSAHGSSPRAWGTPNLRQTRRVVLRFIPTCMGNSDRCEGAERVIPVHPHVHGELRISTCDFTVFAGSSPRAWGTLGFAFAIDSLPRFIPTCMGNSLRDEHHPVGQAVHPHVHGELSTSLIALLVVAGSSPRAWGTH